MYILILFKTISIVCTILAYMKCITNQHDFHTFSEYFSYVCSTTYYLIFSALGVMLIHCLFVSSIFIIICRLVGMGGILTNHSKWNIHLSGVFIHTLSSIHYMSSIQKVVILGLSLKILLFTRLPYKKIALTLECIWIILSIYWA